MIFELAQDIQDTVAKMPREHEKHSILELLEQTIRLHSERISEVPWGFFSLIYSSLISRDDTQSSGLTSLLDMWVAERKEPWLKRLSISFSVCDGELPEWSFRTKHRQTEMALAYAPKENILMAATKSKETALWDLNNGYTVRGVEGVLDLVYSRQGSDINALLFPKRFSVTIDDCQVEFECETDSAFPGGYSISAEEHFRKIKVRRGPGSLLGNWRPHDSFVTSLIHLGSRLRFATASYDGEVAVWDASRIVSCGKINDQGHDSRVRSIDVDRNGTKCISVDINGNCIVWNLDADEQFQKFKLGGHFDVGPFVAFCSDANHAFVQFKSHRLLLLDTTTGETTELEVNPPSVGFPNGAGFERDMFAPLCSTGYADWVLWHNIFFPSIADICNLYSCLAVEVNKNETENGPIGSFPCKILSSLTTMPSMETRVDIADFSAHKLLLAVNCQNRIAMIFDWCWRLILCQNKLENMEWQMATQNLFSRRGNKEEYYDGLAEIGLQGCRSQPCALAMDASRGIVGDSNGKIAFLDLLGLRPSVKIANGHEGPVIDCCMRGDGRYAASIGFDRTTVVWDCENAEPVSRHVFEHTPSSCKLSEDGSVLVIGSLGGDVSLLMVENINKVVLPGPEDILLQEEKILSRLKERYRIMRLKDIDQLLQLSTDVSVDSYASFSAGEQLIKLATTWAYKFDHKERQDLRTMISNAIMHDNWRELRTEAVGVLYDKVLLENLIKDPNKRVSQAAAQRLQYITQVPEVSILRREGYTVAKFTVNLDYGLACNVATMAVVGECQRYGKSVTIERIDNEKGLRVDAESILDILQLSAKRGTRLRIHAEGEDAEAEETLLRICSILASEDGNNPCLDKFTMHEGIAKPNSMHSDSDIKS